MRARTRTRVEVCVRLYDFPHVSVNRWKKIVIYKNICVYTYGCSFMHMRAFAYNSVTMTMG